MSRQKEPEGRKPEGSKQTQGMKVDSRIGNKGVRDSFQKGVDGKFRKGFQEKMNCCTERESPQFSIVGSTGKFH